MDMDPNVFPPFQRRVPRQARRFTRTPAAILLSAVAIAGLVVINRPSSQPKSASEGVVTIEQPSPSPPPVHFLLERPLALPMPHVVTLFEQLADTTSACSAWKRGKGELGNGSLADLRRAMRICDAIVPGTVFAVSVPAIDTAVRIDTTSAAIGAAGSTTLLLALTGLVGMMRGRRPHGPSGQQRQRANDA